MVLSKAQELIRDLYEALPPEKRQLFHTRMVDDMPGTSFDLENQVANRADIMVLFHLTAALAEKITGLRPRVFSPPIISSPWNHVPNVVTWQDWSGVPEGEAPVASQVESSHKAA